MRFRRPSHIARVIAFAQKRERMEVSDFGTIPQTVEKWLGIKPKVSFPPEFTAAGFVLASDGVTVTNPNGQSGTYDPTSGTITTADGTIAPHGDLTGTNVTVTSDSAPTDITEMARNAKGTIVGGAIGVGIGAVAGMTMLGPIGARVGGVVGGVLGAWIGNMVT
jgi:hypothetical protein